ncbi:helix-turn-helix domain-containing protein [Marinobacter sp. NP-4(2019)]|uniref:helix-turn-helix domain-containing protein n=1 Tax=Marinobacter sp. NP-4(2019) TaxID=2488665 RepID=UPI001D193285|nr:LysR family transcriptional regulator [Marinobacter sp. NP-4(2019)]
MEYFKRIYELGSFTAAANEFRCSNAVISKYVKFLESWTGAKLILRNTRTISFTDEEHPCLIYSLSSDANRWEFSSLTDDTAVPLSVPVSTGPSEPPERCFQALFNNLRRITCVHKQTRLSDVNEVEEITLHSPPFVQ